MCSSPGAADSCAEENWTNDNRCEGRNARGTPWQYCRNSRRLISLRFFRDRLSEIPPVFYCAKAKSSIGLQARQVCGSVPNAAIGYDNLCVDRLLQREGRVTVGPLAKESSLVPGVPSDHDVVRPDRQP